MVERGASFHKIADIFHLFRQLSPGSSNGQWISIRLKILFRRLRNADSVRLVSVSRRIPNIDFPQANLDFMEEHKRYRGRGRWHSAAAAAAAHQSYAAVNRMKIQD